MAASGVRRVRIGVARSVLRWLAPIARHPATSIVTGMGLLISGVADLLEDVITDFETVLESYHGLIVFGLVTALRGIAEGVEGIEWLSRDAESIEDAEEKQAAAVAAADAEEAADIAAEEAVEDIAEDLAARTQPPTTGRTLS